MHNLNEKVLVLPLGEDGIISIIRYDDDGEAIYSVKLADHTVHLCREYEMERVIELARYTIEFNEQASKIFDQCVEFLKGIKNTEERERLTGTLQHCFDILNRLGNAQLMYDFAPLSFTFRASGLYGGLIFHGPTDGSGPNYSVELSGIHGWSLHT